MGAPRCSDCNKFVSLELAEPEVTSIDFDSYDQENSSGLMSVDVRMVLCCFECGTEVREANVQDYISFEHECSAMKERKSEDLNLNELDWEIEHSEAEGDERYEDTDRRGKKIKSSRYMKKFYMALIGGVMACPICKENILFEGTVEEQAGNFEDI